LSHFWDTGTVLLSHFWDTGTGTRVGHGDWDTGTVLLSHFKLNFFVHRRQENCRFFVVLSSLTV